GTPPDVEDARRWPIGREALNDHGGGDECVVGSEWQCTVASAAAHGQAAPTRSLLADGQRKHRTLAGWYRHAPRFRDDVVRADDVSVVLEQMRTAPGTRRLLVGDGREDQRPLRPEAIGSESPTGDGHRRREVEHVDGAAPPDEAILQVGGKRIVTPA